MKLPRFSLRELFLLVIIAAMGCGWWVRERQLAKVIRETNSLNRELFSDNVRLSGFVD